MTAPASELTAAFKTARAGLAPGGISTCADDEETVEMARSRSHIALPTKAAIIVAAEPAAALHLGRGIVSHVDQVSGQCEKRNLRFVYKHRENGDFGHKEITIFCVWRRCSEGCPNASSMGVGVCCLGARAPFPPAQVGQ